MTTQASPKSDSATTSPEQTTEEKPTPLRRRRSDSLKPKSRRAGPPARAEQNVGVLLACTMSVAIVACVTGFGLARGMAVHWVILSAWPPAALAGWIVAEILVLRHLTRFRQQIRTLSRRLGCYGDVSSRETFDRILIKTNDELGELSQSIHTALTTAHKDRLESARIRRDFSDQVHRATQRATVQLTRLSLTDELTGLANRRAFDEALEALYDESLDRGCNIACVSIDLNHFKTLNDTRGHDVGDVALRCVGEVLAGAIRRGDVAARLGGDEFVLLLPDCDHRSAQQLCRRIERLLAQHPRMMALGGDQPTLSCGVASLRRDRPHGPGDLLQRADKAMYRRKRSLAAAGSPARR